MKMNFLQNLKEHVQRLKLKKIRF